MVVETPEKYEKVVLPYIQSFPPSRVEWYVTIPPLFSLPSYLDLPWTLQPAFLKSVLTGWVGYTISSMD